MPARLNLLNVIFVLLVFYSVNALRNCKLKDLEGTFTKRFRARVQFCIDVDNKHRGCRRIQKKEACRRIADFHNIIDKNSHFFRYKLASMF